jgi:hypothetical protein
MTKSKKRKVETPAETKARVARFSVDPVITAGAISKVFVGEMFVGDTKEGVDLQEIIKALNEHTKAVHGGDLKFVEEMLVSQASTLNTIFGSLCFRSAKNIQAGYLEASDTYMRLALRAQSQSRATLETLATVKNPPVVFAKQANIANGPQQVNNGEAVPVTVARVQNGNPPIKLLEHDHGKRLDTRKTRGAGTGNPPLATVEAIHRPAHGRRKARIKS